MRGNPVTKTFSENAIVTLTVSPALYVLSAPAFDVKAIDDTVGEVVSIVTVKPEEVEVTVESSRIVVD
jgi:hypothetical protein